MQYAQELFEETGIICRFDYPQSIPYQALSSDVRHNVFLVIKEGLNNIVKHSEATEVSVKLLLFLSGFEISITDNGKGFDMEKRDQFSNGLNNMQNRIKDIEGEILVESSAGKGTRIKLALKIRV